MVSPQRTRQVLCLVYAIVKKQNKFLVVFFRVAHVSGLICGLFQGVTVVRVAGKAAYAYQNVFVQCGGGADLAAKFIGHPGLAHREAVDLGLMQGGDLIAPLWLRMQQPRHQGELGDNPVPWAAFGGCPPGGGAGHA